MSLFIFSHHAQRRMKLYKIFLSLCPQKNEKYEILSDLHLEKYRHPLKVVVEEEAEKMIIITVYPLKKERLP